MKHVELEVNPIAVGALCDPLNIVAVGPLTSSDGLGSTACISQSRVPAARAQRRAAGTIASDSFEPSTQASTLGMGAGSPWCGPTSSIGSLDVSSTSLAVERRGLPYPAPDGHDG
jgi:hypothetical protein